MIAKAFAGILLKKPALNETPRRFLSLPSSYILSGATRYSRISGTQTGNYLQIVAAKTFQISSGQAK